MTYPISGRTLERTTISGELIVLAFVLRLGNLKVLISFRKP
jgi:hypothetical protein